MNQDPLVPRATDPETSHHAFKGVLSLKRRLYTAASCIPFEPWTDDDLSASYEHLYHQHKDRGVIARTRLNLLREGYIESVDHDGGPRLLFKLGERVMR